jgi:transposase
MARKPNLLEKVVALALEAASRELPDYAHPRSPHRYTQPQLMAILVLRAYLKLTYRQSTELLETAEGLQRVLGLKSVPRHTTLEEFASRVATPELLDRLLAVVLVLDGRPVAEIAGDSTGLAPTRASAHYLARSGKKGGHYVKLSLILACSLLLPVSMTLARGPANDLADARSLLWRAAGRCSPKAAYFDSGYDAEWLHRFFRDGMGCRSFVPPVPRTADRTIRTPYRAKCTSLPKAYGRRWHVESFFSGLKASTGSSLKARTNPARFTEAALRVLTYAVRRV